MAAARDGSSTRAVKDRRGQTIGVDGWTYYNQVKHAQALRGQWRKPKEIRCWQDRDQTKDQGVEDGDLENKRVIQRLDKATKLYFEESKRMVWSRVTLWEAYKGTWGVIITEEIGEKYLLEQDLAQLEKEYAASPLI
ncbi:hypothetical protein NDU88_005757 [Pleurodeles waltl]|uniref:Uncharacterized protein n=1 Tax=Pleurodeles waltl TaxID=8319 RepID=A0AAV7WY01_PLEWA|nr:hypothetical protein NDU88_005757 [Pleurodeles waltl]